MGKLKDYPHPDNTRKSSVSKEKNEVEPASQYSEM